MDRSYLLQQHRSLQDMAIELFRDIIFYDPHLQTKIIGGACDLVATYRQGDNVEESTFRDAIKMFHELSTYSGTFEPRMLELSQSYIIDWTEQTSVEMSLPGYVKASVELMDREMARCEMFGLDATTRRDLLTLLEDHIISRKEDRLSLFLESYIHCYLLTVNSKPRRGGRSPRQQCGGQLGTALFTSRTQASRCQVEAGIREMDR